MPFPEYEPSVPVFVRHVAARFGDRPLIVLGDRRISYREADEQSARLARGLLATGTGKGTRVGLLMPNGPDWVVAWLAVCRIGAVLVPLNTFYKARELGWVLRHADVHTLLTRARLLGNDYLERLESFAPSLERQKADSLLVPELPYLRSVMVWGEGARPWSRPARALEEAAEAAPALDAAFLAEVERCITPADVMAVIYSSGSTAEPKGAIHTQGTMIRHGYNLNAFRDLGCDDRAFSPMPFFWVGGMVFTLISSMHVGACMLCEEAFEPGATLDLLERERATVVAGWPHYAKAMRDHPSFKARDLSSVRAGNLNDAALEGARAADPELRSNSLGMTETCGPHSIDRMDVDLPEGLRGSFGRSVPGLQHKIVDPQTGAALPAGELGEICVRGYSLMQGLYKVEREDSFDAEGFYHTGDAGYLNEEGFLFFKARLGEMIKTAGANVAPREVEIALDAFEEVQGSYVVGLPDPVRGQNVAAAVVLNSGARLDAAELRRRLREELSAYKIPRLVFFCAKSELPFTDSGKIDKRRLAALLADRVAREAPGS